jgi:hypothetical protein
MNLNDIPIDANTLLRMRCFKDNADRGRTYSQYSDWKKITASAFAIPELKAIYNSANGADIRWVPDSNVEEYIVMRKENGVWNQVVTVKASGLAIEGGNYKYIDSSVKTKYGKGYIYSIAVKTAEGELLYDSVGLPLYRLEQPSIQTITSPSAGTVVLTWNEVDAHGYEVHYSTDGKHWTKAPEVTGLTTTISGLDSGVVYTFRIRCQKTNPARGVTWSQYSGWKQITVR